jgi:putative membrane protein
MNIDKKNQLEIEKAIQEVESQTDAELVCVLARRSDDYYYIPSLWAALVALLSPLPLSMTNWWEHSSNIILIQFFVFISISLLFRWPPILIRTIPKSVRYWRASNMARRQFLQHGLHHTKNRLGLLIFVSEQERYVEILADKGISDHIENTHWEKIVGQFVQDVGEQRVSDGFMRCIQSCGHKLTSEFPATEVKNELPDRLVLIDE